MGDDMKRFAARSGAVLALALALLAPAGKAGAATACGTIITNVASATMWSGFPDYIGYEVSYNASATIIVLCPPVVALRKYSNTDYGNLQTAPAGGTVTFMICVENQTVTSIWGLVVTDRLPVNMTYDQPQPGYIVLPGSSTITASHSSVSAGPFTNGTPTSGQGVPYYLRWTFSFIGPARSACASYSAKIL